VSHRQNSSDKSHREQYLARLDDNTDQRDGRAAQTVGNRDRTMEVNRLLIQPMKKQPTIRPSSRQQRPIPNS